MKEWEFLLQKEGDRAWIPLESADVEILEGKYRVVARSLRPQTKVEVRITHTNIDDPNPQRRVYKRSTSTNQDGLMVVLPFTQLQPGTWQLICQSDPKADPQIEPWQYSVLLDVNVIEDSMDLIEPETIETQELGEDNSKDSMTPEEVELAKLNTWVSNINSTENQNVVTSQVKENLGQNQPKNRPITPPLLKLSIDQSNYIIQPGDAVIICGQIEAETSEEVILSNTSLHLNLKNPDNLEILASGVQNLPEQKLPLIFSCAICVPGHYSTRLVLGDVHLYENNQELATQSFTVTAPLQSILEAIVDQNQLSPNLKDEDADKNLDSSLLKLVKPALNQEEKALGKESLLPPQIAAESPKNTLRPLELPSFGMGIPDRSISQQIAAAALTDLAILSEQKEPELTIEKPPTIELSKTPETPTESTTKPTVNRALPGLNLEERFRTRLQDFAKDLELQTLLKQNIPPTPTPTEIISHPVITPTPVIEKNDNWESKEIVLDDHSMEENQDTKLPAWVSKEMTPYIFPPDQPLPIPILQIITPQLVMGRTATVRVLIPEIRPKIYVKIWVFDRQTRSLIEGPRWITEFTPNGLGMMVGIIDLEIIYGSLEIQLEAISVEVQTQRESQKISIDRQLVPPAKPTLPLEEYT